MLDSYLTMGCIKFRREGENYIIPLVRGGDLFVENPPIGWRISLRDADGNVEASAHHRTLDGLLTHILGQETFRI